MQQTMSQSAIKLYVALYLFRSKLWGADGEFNLKYLPCCWRGLVMQAVITMNAIVQMQPLNKNFQYPAQIFVNNETYVWGGEYERCLVHVFNNKKQGIK